MKETLAGLWLPGLLAMLLGAQFLQPLGLAHAGTFFSNPTVPGWIVLIAAYSGAAYALGWVIRALFSRY